MGYLYKALRQAESEHEHQSLVHEDGASTAVSEAVPTDRSWLESASLRKPRVRPENRLVTISDQGSLGAEKFRVLRMRLQHMQRKSGVKKLLITSGTPGEGKTMVASNLAVSLARNTTQKVLLVEGDLRHPLLASQFGLEEVEGVAEWFQTHGSLGGFVSRIDGLQLWFLPAGRLLEDPLKILHSSRFTDAFNELTPSFDWVVIDAPPLLPMADVHVLATLADGIILVIRQGKTPKKTLLKGLKELDGAKILGTAFNDVEIPERGYYTYYEHYYGQHAGSGNGKAPAGRKAS